MRIIFFLMILQSCASTKMYKYTGFEKVILCKNKKIFAACKETLTFNNDPNKIILSEDTWKNIKQYHIIDLETDQLYCSVQGKKSTIQNLAESNRIRIGNHTFPNPSPDSIDSGYKFIIKKITGNYSKNESYTLLCAEPLRDEVLEEI